MVFPGIHSGTYTHSQLGLQFTNDTTVDNTNARPTPETRLVSKLHQCCPVIHVHTHMYVAAGTAIACMLTLHQCSVLLRTSVKLHRLDTRRGPDGQCVWLVPAEAPAKGVARSTPHAIDICLFVYAAQTTAL